MQVRTVGRTAWITSGISLVIFAIAILLVYPWGNFPVFDDWQYARITRAFASTGIFKADLEIAPSLVGQSLIVLPFIKLFGFSSTLLRIVTVAVSIGLLFIIDSFLRLIGTKPLPRLAALLVIIFNPLFLFLSATFMTEIYGYTVAFLGALLWFRGRTKQGGGDEHTLPLISWTAAIGSAALIGYSFWIRQFCAFVYPSLLISLLPAAYSKGSRITERTTVIRLITSFFIFALFVGTYFFWSRTTGNYRPEFSDHIGKMLSFEARSTIMEVGAFAIYMTAFLMPLFFLFIDPKQFVKTASTRLGLALFGYGILTWILFYRASTSVRWVNALAQSKFPFLGSVTYATGVGPVLLSDVYAQGSSRFMEYPQFGQIFWWLFTALIIAMLPVWIVVAKRVSLQRKNESGIRTEFTVFALTLAIGLALISIQAFKQAVYDRYFFGAFIVMVIAMVSLRPNSELKSRSAVLTFLFFLGGFATFSVAGLHDYFRWNDLRWHYANQLMSRGINANEIDGGYEFNGWYHGSGAPLENGKARYFISMNPLPGYRILEQTTVKHWLVPIPPILLLERITNRR